MSAIFLRYAICGGLALLLANCGSTAYFGDVSRMQAVERIGIYFDRDGSLYPTEGPVVNKKDLNKDTGYLLAYYLDGSYPLQETAEFKETMQANGLVATGDMEKDWPAMQQTLRRAAGSDISKRLDALDSTATLVVLIHGFNNTADEAVSSYQVVEHKLKELKLPAAPHLFLEVYWDGRYGQVPAFFTYSQANAKFVGLSLREILGGISNKHPVRILTHSLGAVVAANALWNVTTTMDKSPQKIRKHQHDPADVWFWQQLNQQNGYSFRQVFQEVPSYKTPTHSDLRLAMLAPATPGQTFTDYLQRTPQQPGSKGGYKKIIIGANKDDEVLTRFHTELPLLGATTLGYVPDDFTRYVAPIVNGPANDGVATRYEMYTGNMNEAIRNKHGWAVYTRNAENMNAFLRELLAK